MIPPYAFEGGALKNKLEKAAWLFELMCADEETAKELLQGTHPESVFQSIDALEPNGWYERGAGLKLTSLGLYKFMDAEEELGISFKEATCGLTSSGSTKLVRLEQDVSFFKDSMGLWPTGAFFHNFIDVDNGFIGAHFNKAPGSDDETVAVPDLKHWSDLVFILWAHLSGQEMKAPKHIMRMAVTNLETRATISHVLGTLTKADWPGHVFDIQGEQGRLLLQTPNGKGVAWLLISHKRAFGVKRIEKVRVWTYGESLHMLFYVADAPNPNKDLRQSYKALL